MAHVGQESGACCGGLLGTFLGQAQILLHGTTPAQIRGKFHDTKDLAIGIPDRIVRGRHPDLPTGFAQMQGLSGLEITGTQLLPERRIVRAAGKLRRA